MRTHTDRLFVDKTAFRQVARAGLNLSRVGPRRFVCTLIFLSVLRIFGWVVRIGQWWDRRWHAHYKHVAIRDPVFIVAGPRSGTTFLHRLMCFDDRFAYFKLFHTILPAVGYMKTAERWSTPDHPIGRHVGQLIRHLERRLFSGWDGIHALGFNKPEEDEGLFVLTSMSAGMVLFTPEVEQLTRAFAIDDLEPEIRTRLMDFYEGCLKRLMYVEGDDRQFLGKSVLLPGRVHTLRERFPDMRFVYLVRHPYESVPSFVSMFRAPWRFHSPRIEDHSPEVRKLADLVIDCLVRMHHAVSAMPADQVMTVHYRDLIASPTQTVESIYGWLGITPSLEMLAALQADAAKARPYQSTHIYSLEQFGLTREDIYGPLQSFCETHGFARDP